MGKLPVVKELSLRQEREIAVLLDCELTAASGGTWDKLDAKKSPNGTYWCPMLECKSTRAGSFSVKLDLWNEVVQLSLSRSAEMRPGIPIRFYGEYAGANTRVLADLIVIDVHDYAELLEDRERLAAKVKELEHGNGTSDPLLG